MSFGLESTTSINTNRHWTGTEANVTACLQHKSARAAQSPVSLSLRQACSGLRAVAAECTSPVPNIPRGQRLELGGHCGLWHGTACSGERMAKGHVAMPAPACRKALVHQYSATGSMRPMLCT